MDKRKNILKDAGVLLTAAILIFTALFVFTPMTKVIKAQPPVFPPAGWVVDNVNGGNTWVQSDTGQRSGAYCAKCTYDYVVEPNDDWLITKGTPFDASGYFEVYIDTYSYGDDEYEIWMSTAGNTPDQLQAGILLADVDSPEVPTVYTPYNFPMSVYAPGIPDGTTVYFAIRYVGFYAWYIWVDDVTFPDGTTEGFEESTPPPPCDIVIGNIHIGTANGDKDKIFTDITNNGLSSVSITYSMTFTFSSGEIDTNVGSGSGWIIHTSSPFTITRTINIGAGITKSVWLRVKGTACFELTVAAGCAIPETVYGCAGLAICS